MTKDEILDALEDGREQFLEAVDGIPEAKMIEPGVTGDWSVKDLIAHLSLWEAELIKLLWQAAQGQTPFTAHFSRSSVDELNAAWQQAYQSRPLEQVMADYQAVRKQTTRRVEAFSDQDLNDSQRFPWLKGSPLWEWIAGDSFEHEAEHAEQIRRWRNERGI